MKHTLILSALTALSTNTHAALTVITESNDNGSATNAIEFNLVNVNAGDVVVVATAVNKPLSTVGFNLNTTAAVADFTGNTAINATEVYAGHLSYLTIINGGIYNFTLAPTTANTFTSNSTIYILRADSGEIALADTATTTDTGSPTVTTLNYTFASSLGAGSAVAIEALSTQSGAITLDSNYSLGANGGSGKRITTGSTAVNGTTWSSTHTISPVDDDFAGIGAIFTEVIPEPSSALLLLGSLAPFLIRRRR